MQYMWFGDCSQWEFEVLRSKLSLRIQVHSFLQVADDQMTITEDDKTVMEGGGGYTSPLNTGQGWNTTNTKCTLKMGLDELGLVGAVCLHGIGLQFMIIHGTGENNPHVVILLEEVCDERNNIYHIWLCQGVGCKLVVTSKTLLCLKYNKPPIG